MTSKTKNPVWASVLALVVGMTLWSCDPTTLDDELTVEPQTKMCEECASIVEDDIVSP